ncbi:hypothetical protein SARC_05973 [Sphaeroforma arctica JP610]|uniref:Uncharacterized protein n=1 Tax=Sphaeroforma arctica JP610 TaxID=667725 RepID=A0A0L0FYT3_9EUKA|nr:hypothetical protein SARC_05973 [Sphaeroforma arctica JP610]KNC81716.1 hypothetical protein SARC_05973 [Sphaeroforma arctica JP610]|eukprot:XP_014155618.1 hypothetical protein SARC_05973 [Sphaeroforma arctica JP610]
MMHGALYFSMIADVIPIIISHSPDTGLRNGNRIVQFSPWKFTLMAKLAGGKVDPSIILPQEFWRRLDLSGPSPAPHGLGYRLTLCFATTRSQQSDSSLNVMAELMEYNRRLRQSNGRKNYKKTHLEVATSNTTNISEIPPV